MAADRPRVSIITTAYNYESLVGLAIESALAQDYPDELYEVIVVDDGSTDGTPAAIEPFSDRVKYVRKENGGVISAVNRGIEESSGDLIAYLNADDTWAPDAVTRLVEPFTRRPEVGLSYCDAVVTDADGRPLFPSFIARLGVEPRSGRILGQLMRGNFIAAGTMMFRADLREEYYPLPAVAPWEDWWVAVRVAAVSEAAYVPAPLLRYRFHGGNEVLFGDNEVQAAALRKEIPFRRWMLERAEGLPVDPTDLVAACTRFDSSARALSADPAAGDELLASSEDQRREAANAEQRADRALAERDPERALRALAVALALDPRRASARDRLFQLAEEWLEQAEDQIESALEDTAGLPAAGLSHDDVRPAVICVADRDADALQWAERLDADRFDAIAIVTGPGPSDAALDAAAAEVWRLPGLLAGEEFGALVLDLAHTRAARVVHVAGSKLGCDILPDVRLLPGAPVGVIELGFGDSLDRYASERYGRLAEAMLEPGRADGEQGALYESLIRSRAA
jgi:hypothetical protein